MIITLLKELYSVELEQKTAGQSYKNWWTTRVSVA